MHPAPQAVQVASHVARRRLPVSPELLLDGLTSAEPELPPTKEALLFASLLRGVHW